jgi:transposase-like protein
MSENHFPETLPQFQKAFPDETACANYLEKLRWPTGFICSKCSSIEIPYRFKNRPMILRCRNCQADTHITAGTVMHKTRTPLQIWFWAAYLVTSYTPGLSATQFQRQLGNNRYETAFQILHKLRVAMVRPQRNKIGLDGHVEVDEAFVGGRTRSKTQGMTNKVLVAAAVEVRSLKKTRCNGDRKLYAGRLRLARIPDRGQLALETFVKESVAPGSTIFTDGWPSYDSLAALGYKHHATVINGDHKKTDLVLPMVHLVFSNLKTWLRGTHHGVSPKHLSSYLNEFTFRFNRRFYPMAAVNSVLGIAVQVTGETYKNLYSGHKTII